MIRKATIDDANRMAEIHVFGWRFAYRNLVSDEHLFKMMEVVKRAALFKQSIEEHIEDNYVFEENGIIKAFMAIGPCRDDDKKGSFELWGIYVDPFWTRGGIGTCMVEYCEQTALSLGYKDIYLWALEGNNIGISFYKKSGYQHDGTTKLLGNHGLYEHRYYKLL